MNNIYKIRRTNAQLLVDFIGNKAVFAEKIERSPTQVSRFLGVNPTRNIGERLARHIEHSFCLPKLWLDEPHQQPEKIGQHINNINQEKYEHLHHILCELYQAMIAKQIDESTYSILLAALKNHLSTSK